MTSEPLVSVVTPFYNTQEFLAECIESVLSQSYQHWEYILVDNFSTDGSSEIAQRYAARFPSKIRIVRPSSFLPQVPNYNFGLSCISPESKYCKIVQADDWLFPECIEQMVEVGESDASVGIVSSYRLRGDEVVGDGLSFGKTVASGHEICRMHLKGAFFLFGSATTILYRSEIIRQTLPFYDESILHEDTDSCYRALQDWNFGFVHQVLTFTRLDNHSIRGRIINFNPDLLDTQLQLHKFGPIYLGKEELEAISRFVKRDYYSFLARQLIMNRSREFWQYHLSGLKSGGLHLEKGRLVKHVCSEILWLIVNPGSTCALIYKRLRARQQNN